MKKEYGIMRKFAIECDFLPDIQDVAEITGCTAKCTGTLRPGWTLWEVLDRTEAGCGSLWQFANHLVTMGYRKEAL
jgi:hypothetical protein